MEPKIQILTGAAAIKTVYERVLETDRVDFICLSTGYEQVVGDWYDTDFAPRLMGKPIQTRELLPDTTANREYAKTKDAGKNQVRYIRGGLSESDVIITPTWAALVSFDPAKPCVVLIEELEMVKMLKNQFEREWGSAGV